MRVLKYYPNSIVDGEGVRQVVYMAGCEHHCNGCHNPESWDKEAGTKYTNSQLASIIGTNPYNVTFSGGDPFCQLDELLDICRWIYLMTDKTVWCYTGYTWEEILANPELSSVLPYLTVLVDGRYCDSLKRSSLTFRGSSNQRIIDVQASLAKGEVVLWKEGKYT